MNYGKTSYSMTLKVQFLHVRLDKYKDNIEAYSDMHGERFHQDIIDFEGIVIAYVDVVLFLIYISDNNHIFQFPQRK